MGGQEKYRERYLNRKIYFEEVDALLYLIDIGNEERFSESLDYLEKILKILDELEYDKNLEILIIFSKMDAGKSYAELPEHIKNLNYLKNTILHKFSSFKFKFFATSIFNIYSIIRVFSEAINRKIKNYNELSNSITQFAEKYNLINVILFDKTGLIIYEYPHKDPVFENGQVIHSAKMEYVISSNLEYFAKVENKEDPNFRFFGYMEQNLEIYGYNFYLDENKNEKFYVSIITEQSNPKRDAWNTEELIEIFTKFLKNIK